MRTGLQMATNAGTKTGLEAVVGVMSHGYSLCAPLDDQPFFWTLVSSPGNLGFIEDTMRRWPPYDNLVCPKRPVNGDPIPPAGPPASVEECWGTPCVANGPPTPGVGCLLSSEVCWHPARSFPSWKVCDTCVGTSSAGSCGCVVGQCMDTAATP